jgi:4-hydroxy-3-polyprenylbenzoate decarboxylase
MDELTGLDRIGGLMQMLGQKAPCSIKTMSEIATGVTEKFISRAGDVALKERRRVVLMVRETRLYLGHLRSMAQLTEMGGIIFPPVPAFYARPKSIADLVDHSIGRILDLFDMESNLLERWSGEPHRDM